MITLLLDFLEFTELHGAVLMQSSAFAAGQQVQERTSWTGICMYRQPGDILASSNVFTLETLRSSVKPVKSQANRATY